MHASVALDEGGFREAQGALEGALCAAVCMHDWPRAVHAAEGLLHLSLLPAAHLHQAAAKPEHVRAPAEVLALWQSCRAMREDSLALEAQAPQHHTARVLQRLLRLRQHPVNSDCELWCADMEAADALHPESQSLQEQHFPAAATSADVTPSQAADSSNTPGAGHHQECRGRMSKFINYRAAAMLLQPASALLSSFSMHVSTVVLDVDTTTSTVHACSLRKAADGAGLDTECCHATVDACALEALLKRVQTWENALATSMNFDQSEQVCAGMEESAEGGPIDDTLSHPGQTLAEQPGTVEPTEPKQEQNDDPARKQAEADSLSAATDDAEEEQSHTDDPVLDLRKEWCSMITAMDELLTPIEAVLHHAAVPPDVSAAPAVDKAKRAPQSDKAQQQRLPCCFALEVQLHSFPSRPLLRCGLLGQCAVIEACISLLLDLSSLAVGPQTAAPCHRCP